MQDTEVRYTVITHGKFSDQQTVVYDGNSLDNAMKIANVWVDEGKTVSITETTKIVKTARTDGKGFAGWAHAFQTQT